MENKNKKMQDKKVFVIIIAVILIVVTIISNRSEKFDLTKQLSLGQKYLQELEYEQAILTFSKIIETEPMCGEAYIGLAEAYIGLGDIDSAIATLEKGFEMTGDGKIEELLNILREGLLNSNDTLDKDIEIEETLDTLEIITEENVILTIGESLEIEYVNSSNAEIEIISLNEKIATIDGDNVITLADGEVEIQINNGEFIKTISIIVNPLPLLVKIFNHTLEIGETTHYEISGGSSNAEVEIISLNENIVKIENELIIGVNEGITEINIVKGEFEETISISVIKPEEDIISYPISLENVKFNAPNIIVGDSKSELGKGITATYTTSNGTIMNLTENIDFKLVAINTGEVGFGGWNFYTIEGIGNCYGTIDVEYALVNN